jgi:hypothetical protein
MYLEIRPMFRKGTSPAIFLLIFGFAMLTTSRGALASMEAAAGEEVWAAAGEVERQAPGTPQEWTKKMI